MQNLIDQNSNQDLPDGLFSRVMNRIDVAKRRQIIFNRVKLAVFSCALVASVIAFIPALQATLRGLTESGFTSYVSLIFSNGRDILTAWQSFSLAILESLPVAEIITTLVVVVAFFKLLQLTAKYFQLTKREHSLA
ncbi:MAG: hypothetical protein V1763_03150 [Parcubacteria group bacterium]